MGVLEVHALVSHRRHRGRGLRGHLQRPQPIGNEQNQVGGLVVWAKAKVGRRPMTTSENRCKTGKWCGAWETRCDGFAGQCSYADGSLV